MARGSSALGTSIGPMALEAGFMKVRAAPNTTAMAKIGTNEGWGCMASTPSPITQTVSSAMQNTSMLRRSSRSAMAPATRVSRNIGTNWARPTMPTRKALCCTPWVRRATA